MRATFECREALRWANRLAHDLGQDRLDVPHLLDGLIMTDGSHASNILKHLLGGTHAIHAELWALFPGSLKESDHVAEVPSLLQTRSFKRVIEEAIGLAETTEANRLTSGHILASLCGLAGEPSAELLCRRGVTREVVRDHWWLPWAA
jgi:ATP-dependent Clp protease ATP-binding subunit ClpA